MKAHQVLESQSLALRALDEMFLDLMNEARSSLARHPWPEAVGVMALRFIAGDPAGLDQWSQVTRGISSTDLAASLRSVSATIEQDHEELRDVFTRVLLSGLERMHIIVLARWVFRVSQLSRVSIDSGTFGEWLNAQIPRFAIQGVDNSAFSTPRSVARLMVGLADIPNGASILDPCCGFGTVLATAVEDAQLKQYLVSAFGQEISPIGWALCKLRLFFPGPGASQIALGDSLREPAFTEGDHLRTFDRVLCDAPFGSLRRDPEFAISDPYHRFNLSPAGRGSAENAFTQHVISSMKPNGKAILLVSNGLLFRDADALLRKSLISSGLVQTIIALPSKLVSSSAIEINLVILGRNTTKTVLIVDGSAVGGSTVEARSRSKTKLTNESVAELVQIVQTRGATRSDIARCVPIAELASRDFIMVPRQYINPQGRSIAAVDVHSLRAELRTVDAAAHRITKEIDVLLDKLAT